MQKTKYFKGFTLVELIIVITILAILSTIGFISFGVYSKNARDSSRLSTMSTIQKGISLNQVTTDKAILPDDYTQVFASGNLMGYEGIVGENVGRIIGLNGIPKDPKTRESYIYYTNQSRNKVQIMGFLEGEEMTYLGVKKAQAETSTKIPKVTGDNLGIILDSNYNRVTGTGIDILDGEKTVNYKVYFQDGDLIISSGSNLFSNIYNRRTELLNDKGMAILDENLTGYWDMETLTGGKLKDFSKYFNDLECLDNWDAQNCMSTSNPKIVNGLKGKGIEIKGKGQEETGDMLYQQNTNGSFNDFDNITFIGNIKINSEKEPLGEGFNTDYFIFSRDNPTFKTWCNVFLIHGADRETHLNSIEVYSSNNNTNCTNQTISSEVSNKYEGQNIRINEWVNLAYTVSNGKINLYLDGRFLKTINYNGIFGINNYPIIIGNSTFGQQNLNGVIDEVRIYNRALSSSEIQEVYNSTK